MEISEDILFNVFKDWEKKDILPEQKSVLLKSYLNEKKISQRELAKRLGISHSTLHDWVSLRQMQRINNKKAEVLNLNHVTIYSLADRLMYLLTKANSLTDKEIRKLDVLVNEIEKHKILNLDD